ncbi:MAG: tetratricopeptide repeat protein [bacterium]
MHKIMDMLLITFLILGVSLADAGEKTRNTQGPLHSKTGTSSQFARSEGRGRSFYSLGVFAYEDGRYEEAEGNLKKAIALDPQNPFYYHYLGKTYSEMGRYKEAEIFLAQAWMMNPKISGLGYDFALVYFKLARYVKAADLFTDIINEDPSNTLAAYYVGMSLYKQKRYKEAATYLLHAAQENPSIKANSYYHIGICFLKIGKTTEALEKLEYVRNHAEQGVLKENAIGWINGIKGQDRALRPYSIYLKISYQADDHIRYEADDLDIHREEDSYLYFSSTFDLFQKQDLKAGIGYNHYQTVDNNAEEYDLTGSIGNLYSTHRLHSYTIKLSYLPSYYWLDSDSYLMCHGVESMIVKRINERVMTRFTYNYKKNNYFQDNGRDGHSNEILLETYYLINNDRGYWGGGLGYGDDAATHPDYDYDRIKTKLNISLKIPWELRFGLEGRYHDKKYKHIDSYFGIIREDAKYYCAVSLSRKIFSPWTEITAEFSYTQNDSTINEYEYTRNVTGLSLTARY